MGIKLEFLLKSYMQLLFFGEVNYMKEQNKKAILWIAIATILFMELLVFGGWGVSVPIAVIIYYIIVLWQSKVLKIKQNVKKNMLLIPIIMICLCFVFFDNILLKFLNVLFLYVLIILNTSQQLGVNRFKTLSFEWLIEIIQIGIIMPLENIMAPINLMEDELKGKPKNSINTVVKILIGLTIGLPIVFIATLLLMNSDIAFKSIISFIGENFNFNLEGILKRIIVFIIIFFPLYGFFYGIRNKKEEVNNNKEQNQVKVKFDFTIIITATSLLCIVYMIYCLAQFTYFISAFQGLLPEDYTFARYARKGFFECLPLGVINLIFIMVLSLLTNLENSNKKKSIVKGFIYYIIAFTLFLVISAFSKMILYISAYGITLMRVYVAWFLILGCIILLLIGVKISYSKFKLTQNIFIVFIIMFVGLNYVNIDYRIAKYDADLYMEGKVNTISAFNELSASALEPLVEISKIDKEGTEYLLKKYESRINKKVKWQDWNLVNYNARKILKNKKDI